MPNYVCQSCTYNTKYITKLLNYIYKQASIEQKYINTETYSDIRILIYLTVITYTKLS